MGDGVVTMTRNIEFDAGHRVTRHESKCRNVHGHRYRAEITVEADALDHAGRVVDFGVVKEVVGGWLMEHLDHGYVAHPDDPVGHTLREQGHKVYTMPDGCEPTAENMAALIGEQAQRLMDGVDPQGRAALRVVGVRLYETPNGWADWKPA